MSKISLTMAQALVKFLDNQYLCIDGEEIKFVQGIFAIFGHGNVLGLGQALEQDQGSLTVYQGRNEQGMAHAAIAFAKQKLRREIIACTSSVGPGAANMITAAATATANRIPLLLLPGDVYATRQPDPVLQQIEQPYDLSISTNDAFRAVSKYWDRITRPEQLMSACISAMRVLTDPVETGAVTLCLPQDVQGEVYDYPDYFFEKRCHYVDRRLPNPIQLTQAIALLSNKQRPLIICGGGVKYSGAETALLALVEQCQIPFAETQAGKGAIPSDHPFNLGGIGETGALAANLLAKKADLIIGIGTRYTDFTTSSKWLFQNPDVQFININVSRFDAYKLDAIQLLGDAKATLALLLEQLLPYQAQWQQQIIAAKQQYHDEVNRVHAVTFTEKPQFIAEVNDAVAQPTLFKEFHAITGSHFTQSRALGIVNQNLPEGAIVVAASGSLPGDLQRVWQARGANDYHVEYGYSCMGYEVNGGLGVKLAEPNREVYVMVGDGAFMMLHSELVTSIQEHKKINVILFDNMTNGCINNLQVGNGMGSYTTEFRFREPASQQLNGGLIPVNYAQVAAGYGCQTFQVNTPQQLQQALAAALLSPVSTLIDIKVLPKTMVHGYLSWWRVGVAQTSTNPKVNEAAQRLNNNIAKVREY